MNDLDNTN